MPLQLIARPKPGSECLASRVQGGSRQVGMDSAAVAVHVERTGVLPFGLSWDDVEERPALFNIGQYLRPPPLQVEA